jgi:hypothetical protein
MLFKEELAQKIIEGVKTQTRRPWNEGETMILGDEGFKAVYSAKEKLKWQIGKSYAVQYGRGLPTRMWDVEKRKLLPYHNYQDLMSIENGLPLSEVGLHPLRIKLLDIRFEDVRTICESDAIAEGFQHPENTAYWGFIETWASFYDKPFSKVMRETDVLESAELKARPAKRYQAWAITFEVVK